MVRFGARRLLICAAGFCALLGLGGCAIKLQSNIKPDDPAIASPDSTMIGFAVESSDSEEEGGAIYVDIVNKMQQYFDGKFHKNDYAPTFLMFIYDYNLIHKGFILSIFKSNISYYIFLLKKDDAVFTIREQVWYEKSVDYYYAYTFHLHAGEKLFLGTISGKRDGAHLALHPTVPTVASCDGDETCLAVTGFQPATLEPVIHRPPCPTCDTPID